VRLKAVQTGFYTYFVGRNCEILQGPFSSLLPPQTSIREGCGSSVTAIEAAGQVSPVARALLKEVLSPNLGHFTGVRAVCQPKDGENSEVENIWLSR